MRTAVKRAAFWLATVLVAPSLASYFVRARLLGADRALEGSTAALGLIPGVLGQYLRRAFLHRVLEECDPSATIEFGVLFSCARARVGARAYVGPRAHIGLAHIGAESLIAAGVHVPSGAHIHGDGSAVQFVDRPLDRQLVRIGDGSWIGAAAVVMADVGPNAIVGAGAVVTSPIPANVVAVGVPARVVHQRVPAS
jgi:acetyltransferase-like isoleucine patch superfamily enzyme